MKRKWKRILIVFGTLVLIVLVGGFIYLKYFFTLHLFEDGPTKNANLSGWTKLEEGMTKDQVISLLGDSWAKSGPGSFTLGGTTNTTPERWEYNWKIGLGLFGQVHPKAYVVYFDQDGKLSSWREPIETNEDQNTESRTTPRTVP
jgi:hypothetical protein